MSQVEGRINVDVVLMILVAAIAAIALAASAGGGLPECGYARLPEKSG